MHVDPCWHTAARKLALTEFCCSAGGVSFRRKSRSRDGVLNVVRIARCSTHSSSPSQHGGALTVLPSKAVGRYSYSCTNSTGLAVVRARAWRRFSFRNAHAHLQLGGLAAATAEGQAEMRKQHKRLCSANFLALVMVIK